MDRRVALVTGSSRGLGAVMAMRLAQDGFAVAVNSAGPGEAGHAVVRAIRERGGVADLFTADVTDADRVAGLVAAVERELGPIAARRAARERRLGGAPRAA